MEYVWVDANVLLRFITGDPPEMAAQALTLFQRAERGEVTLRLAPLVLAEVVWVLTSFYKLPKKRITEVLVPLLAAKGVWSESPDLLMQALLSMSLANVDFVDAFLAETARRQGESVCSFDNDFDRLGSAGSEV